MAIFYGIGVGPGDSDLVTVKASKILNTIDILYTPEAKKGTESLALKIASPYVSDTLEIKQRHFPMVKDKSLKQGQWEKIAKEIISDVQNGKNVGFITLGDPMVFSTYSYLLEIIDEQIATQTIPGITSFTSIASEVEVPLVMDEQSFAVIPATAGKDKLEQAIAIHDTVVIMKVSNYIPRIKELLEEHDLLASTIMVSHSSTDKSVVKKGILDLKNDEKLSYFTTMIVKKSGF